MRSQLLADMAIATARPFLKNGSFVFLDLDGVRRRGVQPGVREYPVCGNLYDTAGAPVRAALWMDRRGRLCELELIFWGDGSSSKPDWSTVKFERTEYPQLDAPLSFLELRRKLESDRHACGRESSRFVDRRAGEQVIGESADPRANAAAYSNHRPSQLRPRQKRRIRPEYAPVVHPRIQCLSGLPERHL